MLFFSLTDDFINLEEGAALKNKYNKTVQAYVVCTGVRST